MFTTSQDTSFSTTNSVKPKMALVSLASLFQYRCLGLISIFPLYRSLDVFRDGRQRIGLVSWVLQNFLKMSDFPGPVKDRKQSDKCIPFTIVIQVTLVLSFLYFVTGLWQNKACWTGVTRYKRAVSRHLKGTPVRQKDFKRLFYRDFLGILYPAEFLSSLSPNGENGRMEKKKTYCRACRAFLLILFPFGRLSVSALKKMKNKTKCRHYIAVLTAKEVNNLLLLRLS